ncbi:hypothetical protein D3C72_1883630 [compost metagenome]
MTLSSMRSATRTVRATFSVSSSSLPPTSFMWRDRLTEPRLQTAISSSLVLRVISVHRLELWTTPTCCCGLRMLHGSLNVTHGWPVSNSMVSILRHRVSAGICLNTFSSPRRPLAS